jgi:undecaprenyl diphosphate synthase
MDLPDHIAIVMDGNGRWANERDLRRVKGHEQGAESVREITEHAASSGLSELTLFTFSMDNWKRPDDEISFLMDLLNIHLQKERETIMDNDIVFRVIGRIKQLPSDTQELIHDLEQESSENGGMILRLALNYAGKQEILDAVREISEEIAEETLDPDDINREVLDQAMYDPDMKDPDLLVRTGGEKRISNFLLWQLSYTEIYFTDTYWPEFRSDEFDRAVRAFNRRERRYGGLKTTS